MKLKRIESVEQQRKALAIAIVVILATAGTIVLVIGALT